MYRRIFDIISSKRKNKKSKAYNIVLNEEDFRKLTSGGVLKKNEIKIIISDIGYEKMASIVAENFYESRYLN